MQRQTLKGGCHAILATVQKKYMTVEKDPSTVFFNF